MPSYKVKQKKDKSVNGRAIVRSDSRPKDFITYFTMRGDSLTGIGDGTTLKWDFSDSNNDIDAPTGYRRKRVEFGFSEFVYIKEGSIYFFSAPKGCYGDVYLVCKTGGYYPDPNGQVPGSALGLDPAKTYTQAIEDTIVTCYVRSHFMQGSAPLGDELNTEGAAEESFPSQQSGYVLWVDITTPDHDDGSNGYFELEVYRPRTVLLPGEAL